ncbi:uncharacterized protein LOC134839566 isoform X2 [Symsagittifera roscoffensis]|uniref:uncharacterized protein LOC134839566 isoform X2 n=1 Tax=Symsagittifera roscoffensis TaxID=84072 RepID=UPI00307BF426
MTDTDCNKTGANKLSLPQSSLAVLLSHSKTNTRHNTYVQADDVTNVDHQFSDYRLFKMEPFLDKLDRFSGRQLHDHADIFLPKKGCPSGTTKEKVHIEGDESVEISDVDSVEKRMNVSQLINRFEYIQHSQENRSNSDFWKYRENKAAAVKASVNRARHHSYSSVISHAPGQNKRRQFESNMKPSKSYQNPMDASHMYSSDTPRQFTKSPSRDTNESTRIRMAGMLNKQSKFTRDPRGFYYATLV